MNSPHDLVAFPLLALAGLVLIAVAIVGGELIRRLFLRLVVLKLGPTHADLDGAAARRPQRARPADRAQRRFK